MRVRRFIFYICSLLIMIGLVAFLFIYPRYFFPIFLLLIIISLLNIFFKKKEKEISNAILLRYTISCDPDKYIDELKVYASKCILSKKQKFIYDLYYVMAYIDKGDFNKAKDILLFLDNNEQYLDEICLVLYLKAWSDYFYFNYDDEKMKEVLLKLKDIILKSNNRNFKMNYSILYTVQEAKYYILKGENLDRIQTFFEKRRDAIPTVLNYVKNTYQLAMIDIRRKNYLSALDNLKKMYDSKKNQYVVTKGKQLYLELCDKLDICPDKI